MVFELYIFLPNSSRTHIRPTSNGHSGRIFFISGSVSVASVVGIVFGVIFGIALLLVVAFMVIKKMKGLSIRFFLHS